ncbi:MAG TPA: hypothetical protein VM925_06545 [Labilithrix sp.]|nr:hypothetical protein [Labilithrix sp.]
MIATPDVAAEHSHSERLIGHPAVLGAIATLVSNDHVLKHAHPSWLTGKLSDAAGLFFFPVLLLWLLERALPSRERGAATRKLASCALVTAVVFSWIKVDPSGTEFYRLALAVVQWPFRALGALTHGAHLPALAKVLAVTDPTDLFALPFTFGSLAIPPRRP